MNRPKIRIVLPLLVPLLLFGQRLPIVRLTMAQGLISNSGIFSIQQDAQGFIWIATHEGLSRFDGSEFRNYGPEQGLAKPAQMHRLLVRHNGELWCLFGAYRYDARPFATKRFQHIPISDGTGAFLLEDHQQTLWSGTPTGLYRMKPGDVAFQRVYLGRDEPLQALVEDDRGVLWIAIDGGGLLQRFPSGKVVRFDRAQGFGAEILCLIKDQHGRVWAGTSDGLFRFSADASSGMPILEKHFDAADGLPACGVYALEQTRNGHLWAGTRCGLVEMAGSKIKVYTVQDGLSQNVITSIFEDRDGDLWLGTESAGVMRLRRDGMSSFNTESGLDANVVDGLFLDALGRVVVFTNAGGRLEIRAGNQDGFKRIGPLLPLQPTDLDVQHWQVVMQDRNGYWWIPGTNELRVFAPSTDEKHPFSSVHRFYDERSGLPPGRIDAMLEDRRGDIWLGLYRPGRSTLVQWIRSLDRFRVWEGAPGVPPNQVPVAFAETRSGSIWIAYRQGDLGRYQAGRHLLIKSPPGHGTTIMTIHEDDAGRLWTGRRNSTFYQINDPDSDCPKLTEVKGIATPFLRCIVSDRKCRLYLGSEAGLTQYDPTTSSIRRYHERDGLPSAAILNAVRDRDGVLWFGTGHGVIRFEPRDTPKDPPPPVWINVLESAGLPYSELSDRGERVVSGVEIAEAASRLQIGFNAISFHSEPRFQYRLAPYDRSWSMPRMEHSVTYPHLPANRYRFEVRALRPDGAAGEAATLSFQVLAPIWMRGWFLAAVACVVMAAIAALYRYRVNYLIQLERIRSRIASDLHDDLGANLTQIAVMSEDLRSNGESKEKLAKIADSAREMTAALGDVVWSIDPSPDHLDDLFSRMRRFGNDLCEAHRVKFHFVQPEHDYSTNLDPQVRRNLYLIFKEVLRNSVAHSGCSNAEVICGVSGDRLEFSFRDNGSGFDPEQPSGGHGLRNIRRRAAEIDALIEIQAKKSFGTHVSVRLRHKRFNRH